MKLFWVLILAFALAAPAGAQIVNADFEEWEGDNPVGWGHFNYPGINISVTSSEQAFSGDFAARMMINEQFTGSMLSQSIAVTEVAEMVTLELHYAGIPEGCEFGISIFANNNGFPIDGASEDILENSADYASFLLEWEPAFEEYDELIFYITFGAVDDSTVGAVLVDHLVLTGVDYAGVKQGDQPQPGEFALLANYPNPFNSGTSIAYTVSQPGTVDLAVFSLSGQRLATLESGYRGMGSYRLDWDGATTAGNVLPAGTYLLSLNVAGERFVRNISILK